MRVAGDAGVVHQDVDRPERARHALEQRGHGRLARDVALPRPRAAAAGLDGCDHVGRRVRPLFVGDADSRAAFRQQFGDAAADAARAAGDDGDTAGELLFVEGHARG